MRSRSISAIDQLLEHGCEHLGSALWLGCVWSSGLSIEEAAELLLLEGLIEEALVLRVVQLMRVLAWSFSAVCPSKYCTDQVSNTSPCVHHVCHNALGASCQRLCLPTILTIEPNRLSYSMCTQDLACNRRFQAL